MGSPFQYKLVYGEKTKGSRPTEMQVFWHIIWRLGIYLDHISFTDGKMCDAELRLCLECFHLLLLETPIVFLRHVQIPVRTV